MTLKPFALLVAAGTLASAALGQLAPAPQPTPPSPAPAPAPQALPSATVAAAPSIVKPVKFTDDEFAAVAQMLTGTWQASIPGSGEVVLGFAPVSLKGMTDCLYAELAFANSMDRPFRQTIWQLHRVNGKLRIKTLEFRTPQGRADHIVGLWAAPDAFPATIGQDDLIATMDMELTKNGNAYHGKTIQPYPTTVSNAVEMTGELKIDGSTYWTADRGFNADGKQVWGPAAEMGYTFNRLEKGPQVRRIDGGVIVVDYPANLGNAAGPGQSVSVQYIGYLENGSMFDSSYERGTPYVYTYGDTRMIDGWTRAMADARKGQVRRVVIPGALGTVRKDAKAPPGANLIYDVRVVDVNPAGKPAPVIHTNAGGPKLEPVDPNDPAVQKMQEDMRRRMEAKRKAQEEAAKNNPKPAEPDPKK